MTDGTADLGTDLEQSELREVVWSALAGLTPSEREIIELNLGHELAGADLADALGVPRNQAHAMASRARSHFEAALGVLLVARSGREDCPELAAILEGWDGRLTVLLRKRVGRHIRRCDVCGDRQRRELSPVSLLSVLPVAALPAALRHQVLSLIADGSPGAVAQRLAVGQRVGPARARGLPAASRPAVAGPAASPRAPHGVRAGRRGRRRGRDRRRGAARRRPAAPSRPGQRPGTARPARSSAPPAAGSSSRPRPAVAPATASVARAGRCCAPVAPPRAPPRPARRRGRAGRDARPRPPPRPPRRGYPPWWRAR